MTKSQRSGAAVSGHSGSEGHLGLGVLEAIMVGVAAGLCLVVSTCRKQTIQNVRGKNICYVT